MAVLPFAEFQAHQQTRHEMAMADRAAHRPSRTAWPSGNQQRPTSKVAWVKKTLEESDITQKQLQLCGVGEASQWRRG